jgi:hypothetical protein
MGFTLTNFYNTSHLQKHHNSILENQGCSRKKKMMNTKECMEGDDDDDDDDDDASSLKGFIKWKHTCQSCNQKVHLLLCPLLPTCGKQQDNPRKIGILRKENNYP